MVKKLEKYKKNMISGLLFLLAVSALSCLILLQTFLSKDYAFSERTTKAVKQIGIISAVFSSASKSALLRPLSETHQLFT